MIQAELKKWVRGGIYRLAVLQELKKERAREKRASKKEKKNQKNFEMNATKKVKRKNKRINSRCHAADAYVIDQTVYVHYPLLKRYSNTDWIDRICWT